MGEEIYQVRVYVCAAVLAVCLRRDKCILFQNNIANLNNIGLFSRGSKNSIITKIRPFLVNFS